MQAEKAHDGYQQCGHEEIGVVELRKFFPVVVIGVGLKLGDAGPPIPIVSAAVLHDLGNDGDKTWGEDPPYRRLGAEASTIDAQTAQRLACEQNHT